VGVSQTLEILQSENPHVPLLPRDIYNARAAINRNPQKVATGLAENRPAIYSKPHPSAEERIRADLRRELANAREELDKLKRDSQKEIEELKAKLQEKENMIKKFEEFIDICNGRVMVSLSKKDDGRGGGTAAS
jgi:flagellar motility protein MotE (MotC chaperone)